MNPRGLLAISFFALSVGACIHGAGAPVEVTTQSLGNPGVVLSRALTSVQALDYTVTVMETDARHFKATHRGSTFASLFGSDSNCEIYLRTSPGPRENTSSVALTWRARNAGSLAGCRKDAAKVLRAATGEERPGEPRPVAPALVDPHKVLTGGTYGN